MSVLNQFIQGLLRRGRHHFTVEEASVAVGSSRNAVVRALARLKAKGELASPVRGFYVVVPPEYHALGCLPAEQFVPLLMDTLGEPYYAALLSAAQLHGAAHQRPQVFQVIVRRPRAPIECGRVRVEFHVRSDMERAGTVTMNTPRGPLRVSSPETTALELVGYARHAGGIGNVAALLTDLSAILQPDRLVDEAHKVPVAWVQRLGYLLQLVEATDLANALEPFVREHATRVTPLDASRSRTGAPRSTRWRLAINTLVEPEP